VDKHFHDIHSEVKMLQAEFFHRLQTGMQKRDEGCSARTGAFFTVTPL